MSFMGCPRCGGFVHSGNLFFCEPCWLKDMTPFAQLIYLLKKKAEQGVDHDQEGT